ncbi:MAG: ABC-F family ATP-binding cassette domain-containing protein [Planctomycetota bacterium]
MTLLVLRDVHKHWPGRDLLAGASLQIDPGEKLGLVGPNGAGKTTLLRLITGQESVDGGEVTLRRGARLGYVPQRPEFPPTVTVREHVASGLADLLAAIAEHHAVSEQLSGNAPEPEVARLLSEQDRLLHRIDELGGWEHEHRVDQVLAGVGLAESLWERQAATLSGGEKSRVALAAALVAGHDLLLLDEPTNHLDLQGIEWIEEYLHGLRGAVLIVSHDRRLLDTAVDAVVELEGARLARYPGGYTKYVRLREERYLSERREWEKQQEYVRKEDAFIRRNIGSHRSAEAVGRRKRLESLVRLPEPRNDVHAPALRLPPAGEGGELVLEARGLVGGYAPDTGAGARVARGSSAGAGTRVLFSNVDLRVSKGDRIGIVGRNGTGKTTLLRILAGQLAPLSGELRHGHKAICGYYDQETAGLLQEGTPMTEIRRGHPLMTDQAVRNWLGRFLFRGDAVDKPVTALSGGERARLSLARLVLGAPTWLALDEPTNHLDLPGRTALEEALSEFAGAMLFVSHDRAFLDGLCTHIVEVGASAQRVRLLVGNYSAWRERVRRETDEARTSRRDVRRDERRETPRAAEPARNPWRFQKLEQRIMALESEQQTLLADLARPELYAAADKLKTLSRRLAEVQQELSAANAEWESWTA